ncbi:YesL family protein [Salisediminibacterium selenitireducens]|uniref:Integral membrane protein n=1 Tax=Bacillus selenitireducens (strain ATCC 700615 / DSM 15326 / MLS10) TaxID=439292 RepID=D6XXD3_BACIE|nr:DUF624 domain-containing protein [Salisediminibacterium selenitireducens]ADH97990.1 protein of unknown function DUF624 [[Bacillus] selenitireducens MLS10]
MNNWIMNRLEAMGNWVFALAYVNVLWLLFTLAGAVVFTITPATVAMMTCIRRWKEDPSYTIRFDEYRKLFKSEFREASRLNLFLLPVLIMLILNTGLLLHSQMEIPLILMVMYIISVVFSAVMFMHIFTVYALLNKRSLQAVTASVVFGFSHPFHSMMSFLLIVLVFLLIFSTSGLAMFFGISLISYVLFRRNCMLYEKDLSDDEEPRPHTEAVSL